MANSVLQHPWFKQRSKWTRLALRAVQKTWSTIIHPQPISLEYQRWRDRMMWQRFGIGAILAATYFSIHGIAEFYEIFINPEQLLHNLALRKLTYLLETLRQEFILKYMVVFGLLGLLILFRNSVWGRKSPALLVILFPWAVSFIPEMVLGAFLGIPRHPSVIMFMAQVAIVPVYWRLHLVAQIVPLAFFFIVYPLIGLGTFAGRSLYSFSYTVELILVCIICEVGVHLYEKSKQSELEANRCLQLCVHAITHDLRTPVMGSVMLLESIQKSTPTDRSIQLSQSEMSHLIKGYDRLLELMNTLLDNQAFSQSELVLNLKPTDLSAIATTILQDFQPMLVKKNIQLNNQIRTDLPTVNVDAQQVWRVLCNLIGNAINHNPPGLQLTLDAVVIGKTSGRFLPMLKVVVQDNGIGISPTQKEMIFEPYTRTQKSQYQPGLGLGLYICRQIVLAHGGEIGLEHLPKGTMFWFTLPLKQV